MKDVVHATEEASTPQKEHSALQTMDIKLFSIFMGHLYSPESGYAFPMRIRIRPTIINAEPSRSGSGPGSTTRQYTQNE